MSIDKLYEIENNDKLFSFKFETYNLPMWAFIRCIIIDSVFTKLYLEEERIRHDKCVTQKSILKYYLKTACKTPFYYKKKDIMFIYPAAGELLEYDGKYKSRIFGDYFLAAKKKSLIIQQSLRYTYKTPGIDDDMRFSDMAEILIERNKTNVSVTDLNTIKDLILYIKRNLSVELDQKTFDAAANKLINIASKIRPSIKYFKRLYKSASPKIVVLNCAHYLEELNPIKAAVAKKMGITVAEVQHGIIRKTHVAYNFGLAALNNKDFINLLPDYFLTYGDYWKDSTNTPSKIIPIGNPNFYNKEKHELSSPKNTILVLYNIPDAAGKCLSDYAIELAKQLPDYEISYRFHPLIKRDDIFKKLSLYKDLKNLKIDTNADVYTSIYENEHVVSEGSTVIYEAACLKRKVYVLKTEDNKNYIDPNMVILFDTIGELTEKIKNKEGIEIDDETKESIFGSGFPGTYLSFLSDIGIHV